MSTDPHELALKFLSSRRLSRQALTERLKRQGITSDDCERTIVRLEELGLINDQDYARDLVQDMLRHSRHGPAGIRARLLQRGIPADLIDEAMASADIDWQEIALRVAEGYDIEDQRSRDRLLRRLGREGFSSQVIRSFTRMSSRRDLG